MKFAFAVPHLYDYIEEEVNSSMQILKVEHTTVLVISTTKISYHQV